MGLKYRGVGAAALTAGLLLSLAAGGPALAADDVVMDGVVTVHWVDPDDGPIVGATITISFYHDPTEPIHSVVPGAFMTDGAGDAVITGVPHPGDGADTVFLDIRGDLATATVDEAGCTEHKSWVAETDGVPSEPVLDVVLETGLESISLDCPEPTPTPEGGEPTPTPTPAPSGGVLGTTGTPAVTPPSTDAIDGPPVPSGSPFVPAFLALVALVVVLVPVASIALARARSRPGRRR